MFNGLDAVATFEDCVFQGNSASDGGAVVNTGGIKQRYSGVTLKRCTFESNIAAKGGAVYNQGGVATLRQCRFRG